MQKFQGKYRVETARAKWWDYNNEGSYFVTICTKNREHLFGYIKDGDMILNEYGMIVSDCWFDLPNHYNNIVLGAFQIMPNHIHCIVSVDNSKISIPNFIVQTGLKPVCTEESPVKNIENDSADLVEMGLKPVCTTDDSICAENFEKKVHGVFEFMRALKSFSSRRINEKRNSKGISNWQERFHDHIIRNESEYYRIENYIINNPKKWKEDCFFGS
jgi:putative transposase